MSSSSHPISPARFAAALESLSVSSLYLKVAELQNSITHLHSSNAALEEYVRQDNDKDCYEALVENKEVIKRMEERVALIRREVTEVRGLPWQPEHGRTVVEAGERMGDRERSSPITPGRGEDDNRDVEGGNGVFL